MTNKFKNMSLEDKIKLIEEFVTDTEKVTDEIDRLTSDLQKKWKKHEDDLEPEVLAKYIPKDQLEELQDRMAAAINKLN